MKIMMITIMKKTALTIIIITIIMLACCYVCFPTISNSVKWSAWVVNVDYQMGYSPMDDAT